MEKTYYIVCPNCLEVEESTDADWDKKCTTRYRYSRNWKNEVSWDDYGISKCIVRHGECDFSTETWNPEDFEVVFKDGEIVEVGKYWKEHKEEFEKIKDHVLTEILTKYL